ncbi:MAG TPA: hypothetical protein VN132_10505, partial [Bdellovibrio sp.]|nr:hypothetical protein [Bdellovibrio sp.]
MIAKKIQTALQTISISVLSLSFIFLTTSCAKSGQFPSSSSGTGSTPADSASGTNGSSSTDTGGSSSPAPTPAPAPQYKMTALSWESSAHPERTQWSQYLQNIILNQWSSLLPGADDMSTFCPKYDTLDNDHRANVWAALFSGVAKYESGYSPTSRYLEGTMGTDPITGNSVYSEGLLQLSYQDIQVYPFCQFDWSKDKNLSPTDPTKTILDPDKNLYCGVGIMAKQISKHGRITITSGVYWSTLKPGGSYQQISG